MAKINCVVKKPLGVGARDAVYEIYTRDDGDTSLIRKLGELKFYAAEYAAIAGAAQTEFGTSTIAEILAVTAYGVLTDI